MTHIGSDAAFQASEESLEDYGCAVAKRMYLEGRQLLAFHHWQRVAATLEPTYDSDEKQRALGARAFGNLSVCAAANPLIG